MKWLMLCVGIMVVVAIVLFLFIRTGTVYFFNGSGYRAFSKGQMHKHEVSQDKLRLVIERMLPGDRFDMLWVSWKDDEYSGIMLTLLDGPPKLSISFKTKTEQPELKSFKAAMAVLNYPVEEDSDSFNGGFGEENRITSLEYPLPKSADEIVHAANVALTNLQGSAPESFFINATRFVKRPTSGSRIKFDPDQDPLEGVL